MLRSYTTVLISIGLLFIFLCSSCGASRQSARLEAHKSKLALLAESDRAPEEKLDIMMEDFTNMMHESLDILNPKKGVAYVKAYGEQNDKAIRSIMDQASVIPEQKGTLEMIEFALGMTNKPYMKDFMDLLPRFQRRYNQISFILGLTGKVKDGLKILGLKALGL